MPYDPNEIFAAAAALAALGMKVVKLYGVREDGSCTCSKGRACPSIGKHPAGEGWQHLATDNEDEIATWFEDVNDNIRWNIGVRLGRVSGIVDVEADDEHAIEVMKRFGLDQIDTTAYKGSRGPHYLFQYDSDLPDVGVVKVDGLEVRIGGGEMASQSVFPKSWHRTGVQYNWLPGRSPEDVKPARLPDEFKEAVIANSKAKGSGVIQQARDILAGEEKVEEGGRHAFLLGIASWLAQQCRDFSDSDRVRLTTILRSVNQFKCAVPKTDEEIRKLANDQFDHYRNRHLERNARRPLEQFGLEWDPVAREYEPGQWHLAVVHSDPTMYRLIIPHLERGKGYRPYQIPLDSNQLLSPKAVAAAVLAVTKKMDLHDPNPGRWSSIWNGEQVENEAGERRQVRSLRAKLLGSCSDEHPSEDVMRYAYVANQLLNYLRGFEKFTGDQEDDLPNPSGVPKWRRVSRGGVSRDELWLKWGETWDRVRQKNNTITPKDISDLRTRLLEAVGEKEFASEKMTVAGTLGRWRIWGDAHIRALERLSGI